MFPHIKPLRVNKENDISQAEEEFILGDDSSQMTAFKAKKFVIENRSTTWLQRFAQKIDGFEIVDPPKSYSERRYERMKKSGWQEVQQQLPEEPAVVQPTRLEEMMNYQHERNNLCYICWGTVAQGPGRRVCLKCPVVSHAGCVVDVAKYKLPIQIQDHHIRNHIQKTIVQHNREHAKGKEGPAWICPFCAQDAQYTNSLREKRYQHSKESFIQAYAAIKLQSYIRMVKPRCDYYRVLNGIRLLQQMFRIRKYWQKQNAEQNAKRWKPFRLRIHALRIIVRISPQEKPFDSPVFEPFHHKIGELAAPVLDRVLHPDSTESSLAEIDPEMVQLLRVGHLENPAYTQPFRLAETRNVSRGCFCLTASVTMKSSSSGEAWRQLYKVDSMLKYEGKPEKLRLDKLMKLGVPGLTQQMVDDLNVNHRILKFTLPKPFFLFPAVENGASLKLTVSQVYSVAETLKSYVVGQSTHSITNYLIWRRCLSVNQGLNLQCSWDSLPITEDGCKLDIHERRTRVESTAPSSGSPSKHGDGDESSSRSVSQSSARGGKYQISKPLQRNIYYQAPDRADITQGGPDDNDWTKVEARGGIVTWTFLPVSYDGNDQAGEGHLLSQPYASSSKRRCWFVLIDRILSVFNNSTDLVPAHILDLRLIHVSPLDDGVIRLKGRLDMWFLHFMRPNDGLCWVRKLYSQSASHDVRKYNESMLFRKPHARPNTPGSTNTAHQWGSWDNYLFELLHKDNILAEEAGLTSMASAAPMSPSATSGAATSGRMLPDIGSPQNPSEANKKSHSAKLQNVQQKRRKGLLSLFADVTLRRFPASQRRNSVFVKKMPPGT